jgi:hypothetical protein
LLHCVREGSLPYKTSTPDQDVNRIGFQSGDHIPNNELTQAADPESTILEELIKEVNILVSYLAVKVNILCFHLTFSYSSPCCIFPLC